MVFGKVVRQVKAATPLSTLIAERLKTDEPVPPLTPSAYIRSSGVSSMCPREEILCVKHKVMRSKKFDASTLMIFAHGTGLHHALQNIVLPALGPTLYGRWRCLPCGKLHANGDNSTPLLDSLILKPPKCGCGASEFIYEEVSLLSEQYRLTGHPDGFLKLHEYEGWGLLEAKSISPKGAWEVRNCPKMDHVVQAQLYMWFTNVQWAQILYWDKGVNGTGALTEHHVERDDDTIDEVLNSIRSMWEGVISAYSSDPADNKALPDRICMDIECPRAGVCSVAKQCFASSPTETP
jgi:hypothetical protein